MTLGQCLQEVGKFYFNECPNRLGQFGLELLRAIKYRYFDGRDYPKDGWLLLYDQTCEEVFLLHKEVEVKIPLLFHKIVREIPWQDSHKLAPPWERGAQVIDLNQFRP